MASLTALTELEAINEMLSLIGETPLASLDEVDAVADAQTAQQILHRTSRQIQQEDWDFNTEEDYDLPAANDGTVPLPANTMKVDPSDQLNDYVAREGKLWDRTNQTYDIGDTVTVTLRLFYDFEDLPATAREYIALAAAQKFEVRMNGAGPENQITQADVVRARARLLEEEAENADCNVIKDSPSLNFRTRNREVY